MPRSRCLAVALLLLVIAVTAARATAPAVLLDEAREQDKRATPIDGHLEAEGMRQHDKRGILSDAHLEEATAHLLPAMGARAAPLASVWAAEKESPGEPVGGLATQGDDQQGSSGSGSGEHGKEEGSGGSGGSKEGEKQGGKSCLTKEECHKKKMLCGKGCTLSAHTKCAAKCTKSCVPTC